MAKQGSKIVSRLGPISKNPPSEFTIEKLSKWLARLNPENGYDLDVADFREMIEDAIDTGELTIRNSAKFPLPGVCPCCHRKHSATQIIPKADIEQWCRKKGLLFGPEAQKPQEQQYKEFYIIAGCKLLLALTHLIFWLIPQFPPNLKNLTSDFRGKRASERALIRILEYHHKANGGMHVAASTSRKVLGLARKKLALEPE